MSNVSLVPVVMFVVKNVVRMYDRRYDHTTLVQ